MAERMCLYGCRTRSSLAADGSDAKASVAVEYGDQDVRADQLGVGSTAIANAPQAAIRTTQRRPRRSPRGRPWFLPTDATGTPRGQPDRNLVKGTTPDMSSSRFRPPTPGARRLWMPTGFDVRNRTCGEPFGLPLNWPRIAGSTIRRVRGCTARAPIGRSRPIGELRMICRRHRVARDGQGAGIGPWDLGLREEMWSICGLLAKFGHRTGGPNGMTSS